MIIKLQLYHEFWNYTFSHCSAQGITAESPQCRIFFAVRGLVANSPTQLEFTEAGLRPKKNRFTLL
jgi:hypothetical protein